MKSGGFVCACREMNRADCGCGVCLSDPDFYLRPKNHSLTSVKQHMRNNFRNFEVWILKKQTEMKYEL